LPIPRIGCSKTISDALRRFWTGRGGLSQGAVAMLVRIDAVAEGRERMTSRVERLVEQVARLQAEGMKNA